MNSLHPGAKWAFRFSTYLFFLFLAFLAGWLFIGVAEGLIGSLLGSNLLTSVLICFFVYLLIAVIVGEIYASLAYKCFKYEFTKDFLKVEKGVIWRQYSNIPYERVQNVDVKRGIIARIIGFSELNIQTAGYSAMGRYGNVHAEGYLPAISIDEAEKIREFLMKRIGKKQGL